VPLAVGQRVVDVTERDFTIKASPKRVPAGDVVFQARNLGPDAHELIVVREGGNAALPAATPAASLFSELEDMRGGHSDGHRLRFRLRIIGQAGQLGLRPRDRSDYATEVQLLG